MAYVFDPMGTTVLITGASSGLGRGFAAEFARRGADLVLVARRRDRLQALADELGERYGTTSTVIAADLAAPGGVDEVVSGLEGRGIRIASLVNNAGYGVAGPFLRSSSKDATGQIDLNITALVKLTHALLPHLTAHAATKPGTGVLLTVSSVAGHAPVPDFAIYAATKAFVLSFTEALAFELKETGVKVLALSPGPTETDFFAVAGNDDQSFGPRETVDQVIQTTFRALDRARTPASVVSGLRNKVQAVGAGILPRGLVLDVAGRVSGR
ncbi:hypothetical protein ALI44B_15010 [Leifsonia sp. ALI-44-B]|uniref:SDR family NAD(P)-dependent oxidoreductase n=1 Tax=Leifsonia sp. ALI-44-B TaxID=1933776 RepID=UPI00097C07BF|nr:SDR family oxidoreductase [Leifsonia sp. ALI-44-B]ONI61673.1 hypothetical protein ALI44B_15010 [Leifsonia sp. ALI-44-B]